MQDNNNNSQFCLVLWFPESYGQKLIQNGIHEMVKNYIFLMAKNQYQKREDNIFMLERLTNSCKIQPVTVDFNPIPKIGSLYEEIIPTLNLDKNYFTPCFILKGDQKFWQSSLSFEKLKFQQRVSSFNEKKLSKSYPLVQPSSNYCQICKSHFSSYGTHINDVQHQLNNRKSAANQMIIEMCNEFIEKNKTKTISKQKSRRTGGLGPQSSRVLRSFHRRCEGSQMNTAKNFSFISTRMNTSQINGL